MARRRPPKPLTAWGKPDGGGDTPPHPPAPVEGGEDPRGAFHTGKHVGNEERRAQPPHRNEGHGFTTKAKNRRFVEKEHELRCLEIPHESLGILDDLRESIGFVCRNRHKMH